MTVEIICEFLAWCSLINVGLLIFWLLWFTLAHDFVYRIHGKWLKLSVERFDAIHYAGMTFFKICIFLFNVVPYIALRLVG
ncbi:MAG: DUF6868 family protein [Nitrospirales bacterium]